MKPIDNKVIAEIKSLKSEHNKLAADVRETELESMFDNQGKRLKRLDKGIIAKLGDRVLTAQELRRLPKGVKDRVVFYPEGATPDDELDEEIKASIHWGFITPSLDDNDLTAQQYDSLPTSSKNNVRFNITGKGKRILDMDDNKRNIFLHFDRWVTKKEVGEMMGIPLKKIDEYVSELVNDGLMEEENGKFKSKESRKFLRVKDYLKYFDKDGKLNVNLIKGMTEKDMPLDKAISSMVMGGIYEAIKKGWIEFMDGRSYTADEWMLLTDVEKETIGVRLTEKGRLEIEDGNPLKIYDELDRKKRADGGLNLVKNVIEKDGEILLELTEEGNQVKKMGEAMGIPPEQIFKTMLNVGLNKEINKFMVLEEKGIEGNRRIKPKDINIRV